MDTPKVEDTKVVGKEMHNMAKDMVRTCQVRTMEEM